MSAGPRGRIALVDDHPLLTQALARELGLHGFDTTIVDPAAGAEATLHEIGTSNSDAAVIDLGLPFPGGGQVLIPALVASGLPAVVLTGETDRWQWGQAINSGASVVLSKMEPLCDIIEAIVEVARGRPVRASERVTLSQDFNRLARERQAEAEALSSLTPREREVLGGLMAGYSVQRLAERDFVSVQTVRSQVKSVLRKLGVASQLEAVATAHAVGWSADQTTI